MTYGTLDDRTAKRISEMLGTATENRRQTNYAGHRLAPWLGHVMVSEQESPRALLTPGEVLQFPATEALVMVGGNPPYRGLKVRYYEDKRFMGRAKLPRPDAAEWQGKELKGLGLPSAWLQLPAPAVSQNNRQVLTAMGHQRGFLVVYCWRVKSSITRNGVYRWMTGNSQRNQNPSWKWMMVIRMLKNAKCANWSSNARNVTGNWAGSGLSNSHASRVGEGCRYE